MTSLKFEVFQDLVKATSVRQMMLKHQPMLESYLVIEEFESEAAAREYLSQVQRLSNLAVGSSLVNRTDESPIGLGLDMHGGSVGDDVATVDNFQECLGAQPADEDDFPFQPLASINPTQTPMRGPSSSDMGAFAAATVGCGARINVMRWRLQTNWHVYGFTLLDNANLYWTHKPSMWTYAANTDSMTPIFPRSEHVSLFESMNKCFSANIRATPGGENVPKQIKTSSGLLIDQSLLVGLVSAKKSNEDIGKMIKRFIDHCAKPEVRRAYWITIKDKMTSDKIKLDCEPATGKYWMKLASGGNNIHYRSVAAQIVYVSYPVFNLFNFRGMIPRVFFRKRRLLYQCNEELKK